MTLEESAARLGDAATYADPDDLNEMFSSGRGPELNAFSFGIIL